MRDAQVTILEDQVDALAGRVADAEQRFEKLLKLLTTPPVRQKLGIDADHLRLRCEVIVPAGTWRHADERRRQLAQAELDEFRRRVARAEARTEWSDETFLEAFDSVLEDEGADDEPEHQTVRLTPDSNIWDKALSHLATSTNRYSFATWLQATTLVSDDGESLVVEATDELAVAWLTTKYSNAVAEALKSLGRAETKVKFVSAGAGR